MLGSGNLQIQPQAKINYLVLQKRLQRFLVSDDGDLGITSTMPSGVSLWRFLFGWRCHSVLQFTRNSEYGSSGTIIVLRHDLIKGLPWHCWGLFTKRVADAWLPTQLFSDFVETVKMLIRKACSLTTVVEFITLILD